MLGLVAASVLAGYQIPTDAYVISRSFNPQTAFRTTGDNIGDYQMRFQQSGNANYFSSFAMVFAGLTCAEIEQQTTLRLMPQQIAYHQTPGTVKIYAAHVVDPFPSVDTPSMVHDQRESRNMTMWSAFHNASHVGTMSYHIKDLVAETAVDLTSVECCSSCTNRSLVLFAVHGDSYVAGNFLGPKSPFAVMPWGLEIPGRADSSVPALPMADNLQRYSGARPCHEFSIMSYNVQNLHLTRPLGLKHIPEQIARAPTDVIALQEICDNNGPSLFGEPDTQTEVISASAVLDDLVERIFNASGVQYAWIDGEVEAYGSGGGWPTVNIRQATLYRTSGNNPISYAGAQVPPFYDGVAFPAGYRLPKPNISEESRHNDEWRPVLVTTFEKCGTPFTVSNSHLKSGTSGNSNPQRTAEGIYVAEHMKHLLSTADNVVAVGDFNDIMETVADAFESRGFRRLWKKNGPGSAGGPYTYVSDGYNSQLDNIFVPHWSAATMTTDLLQLRHPAERYLESDHQPLVANVDFQASGCAATRTNYRTSECCGRG